MNIFVGCSSKVSQNGFYNAIAEEVSEFIAKGKHNLVFGGQTTGLMGRIYESVRDSKQSKIFNDYNIELFVIPEYYFEDEIREVA